MFLTQIDISGFRGIRQLSMRLDQTTILIGENNMGKSTILDALQLALGRTVPRNSARFTEYDHYLSKDAKQAADGDIVEITLHFVEQSDNEWTDEIVQQMSDVIQYDETGRQSLILRVQSRYNASTNETVPEWSFLNLKMQKLSVNHPKYKSILQKLAPVFALQSIRDAEKEFRSSAPFWGPFVRSTTLSSDERQKLEAKIIELNQEIIDSHESFDVVKKHLEEVSKLVMLSSSDTVTIEALSGSVHDVLSRTKMYLISVTGANIPIG